MYVLCILHCIYVYVYNGLNGNYIYRKYSLPLLLIFLRYIGSDLHNDTTYGPKAHFVISDLVITGVHCIWPWSNPISTKYTLHMCVYIYIFLQGRRVRPNES